MTHEPVPYPTTSAASRLAPVGSGDAPGGGAVEGRRRPAPNVAVASVERLRGVGRAPLAGDSGGLPAAQEDRRNTTGGGREWNPFPTGRPQRGKP